MNPTALSSELRKNLELIISMDRNAQKETIERIYDTGAHLESPYMVLNGRDEIIKSYATLSSNNMDLKVDIGSITFDSTTQTCMAEIKQTIRPKVI